MTTAMEIGRTAAQILNEKLALVERLEDRVALIANEIGGRVAFSTSLGVEDQVLLHAISSLDAGADIDVFTLDTGRHFSQTLETLERSELRFGRRIRVVVPDREDLEALVARDGIFGFRATVDARKACCDVRKIRPLRRSLAGASAWVTGLRRSQSDERSSVPFAAWDSEHGLIKLNPIADWSLEQVEKYIADNNVPINPLHAQGYPSIGCEPCTRAVLPGEDSRSGRWWWENEDGKECGLHVSDSNSPAAALSGDDVGIEPNKSERVQA